jgi:hypothetical protein
MPKTLEDASESIIAVADKALYEAKAPEHILCLFADFIFGVQRWTNR